MQFPITLQGLVLSLGSNSQTEGPTPQSNQKPRERPCKYNFKPHTKQHNLVQHSDPPLWNPILLEKGNSTSSVTSALLGKIPSHMCKFYNQMKLGNRSSTGVVRKGQYPGDSFPLIKEATSAITTLSSATTAATTQEGGPGPNIYQSNSTPKKNRKYVLDKAMVFGAHTRELQTAKGGKRNQTQGRSMCESRGGMQIHGEGGDGSTLVKEESTGRGTTAHNMNKRVAIVQSTIQQEERAKSYQGNTKAPPTATAHKTGRNSGLIQVRGDSRECGRKAIAIVPGVTPLHMQQPGQVLHLGLDNLALFGRSVSTQELPLLPDHDSILRNTSKSFHPHTQTINTRSKLQGMRHPNNILQDDTLNFNKAPQKINHPSNPPSPKKNKRLSAHAHHHHVVHNKGIKMTTQTMDNRIKVDYLPIQPDQLFAKSKPKLLIKTAADTIDEKDELCPAQILHNTIINLDKTPKISHLNNGDSSDEDHLSFDEGSGTEEQLERDKGSISCLSNPPRSKSRREQESKSERRDHGKNKTLHQVSILGKESSKSQIVVLDAEEADVDVDVEVEVEGGEETRDTPKLPQNSLLEEEYPDSRDCPESQESVQSTGPIHLLNSVYENRPKTIMFTYPKDCGQAEKNQERIEELKKESELNFIIPKFKISEHSHTYNCIMNAFAAAGMHQTEGKNWNIIWSSPLKGECLKTFTQYQRCNHFPSTWQIGRKDNMWRNINRMKRDFGDDYDICPLTYLLMEDFRRLCLDREEDPKQLWILKPAGSSCGRGIKIIGRGSHISRKQGYVASKYISNPHLINGLKYDLRVYVLVTSFDPLRIYFYEDGLCRFATEKYTKSSKSCKKKFIHLTNYSVNKKGNYIYNKDPNIDNYGSKWSLPAYRKRLREMQLPEEQIFRKMKDLIIKTLIAVEPHIFKGINRSTKFKKLCFELYGFDILIDSNFRPWLLEVNISPSMSSSSPLDKKIKTTLICDTFNLVGIVPYDKKKYTKKREQIKMKKLLGFTKNGKGEIHAPAPVYKGKNINELKTLENFASLPDEDIQMLFEFDEEYYRRGRYERIFPMKDNIEKYAKYFEALRYNNLLVWKWMKSQFNFLTTIHEKIYDSSV